MPKHLQVSEATKALLASGTISPEAARHLNSTDRSVSVANVRIGFEDAVLGCFAIDASPSMEPYVDAVVAGQQAMIGTLRGSAKCRKDALYIGQWLFSSTVTVLNALTPLAISGKDGVTLLDKQSYRPSEGDGTALYASVLHVLQDMAANIAYSLAQNVRTTFTIGVITDGEDNRGGADPSDIKKIVDELKNNEYLTKSVVIGIENPKLPRSTILGIKSAIGFDDAIFVGQSAAEIRRAFALASKSTLGS